MERSHVSRIIPIAVYTDMGMIISINQKEEQVASDLTVRELLRSYCNDKTNGVAVAINAHVVPRDTWQTHQLKPEDKVLIVTATQGG